MKAALYHRYGDADVVEYADIARPVSGKGDVLVKVAGTSFNPVDSGIRGGYLTEAFPISLPHVPGIDVAGTVAEVGDDVTEWKVGDAVVGLLPMTAPGASAEYVISPADVLAPAPTTGVLADAAALPTVGLTAWQALFEVAHLHDGQAVFINGAGGAVGGYAVQLAKAAGAVVTATAKPTDAQRLRDRGADRVVDYLDYRTTSLAVEGQPFDVVLNLVSTDPEQTAALIDIITDGGVFAGTMTSGPDAPPRGVRAQRVFVRSDAAQLRDLVRRVETGQLVIDVADRRPLSAIAAVHADADAGRLPGKTIVTPATD